MLRSCSRSNPCSVLANTATTASPTALAATTRAANAADAADPARPPRTSLARTIGATANGSTARYRSRSARWYRNHFATTKGSYERQSTSYAPSGEDPPTSGAAKIAAATASEAAVGQYASAAARVRGSLPGTITHTSASPTRYVP